MTKSGLPTYPAYVMPTLKAIKARGGSATIEEIEDGVADLMTLSEDKLAVPHGTSGRTEFQYKLAWVRTYLKKAAALQNSERGVWALTERGERFTDEDARTLFQRIQTEHRKRRQQEDQVALLDEAEEEHEEGWIERLLEFVGSIPSAAFERLAQRLLRESGFTKVEVTGRPSDGGIDGIGVLRMNLVSFQVLFQCKRWKGSVGASVVRDFRDAMVGRADKGLIITTGAFTAEARREATRDGAPAIDLIDGETLCQLLKDRRLGVSVTMVEEIELDEGFFKAI
jgi:restriction system protein